jgi:broad specificity phosphatase PhoE
MPTRIFLIRHGLTQWNLEKRYISFTDLDLIEEGRIQAKKVKMRLAAEGIYKVYSSDSLRSFHFAKIIFDENIIEKRPELREMRFGVFEGLRYAEIMKEYPLIYRSWLRDPASTVIPEGEGLTEFQKRILAFFAKIICENKNKTLGLVTHAGPIRVIVNNILKVENFWQIKIDLASIHLIESDRQQNRIICLNDTLHLNG